MTDLNFKVTSEGKPIFELQSLPLLTFLSLDVNKPRLIYQAARNTFTAERPIPLKVTNAIIEFARFINVFRSKDRSVP